MTDEDRQLLLDLRRMTDAYGWFCAGAIEHDLSRDDQLALSDRLAEMTERIRKRGVRTPVVIEGEGQAGPSEGTLRPALPPTCTTGQTGRVV